LQPLTIHGIKLNRLQ